MTFEVKHISLAIAQSMQRVYAYVSRPQNLPEWLAFVKSISQQSENRWAAKTDLGDITLEFVPHNTFGVVDHVVTLPDGTTVANTLRVIQNGTGSEVMFTLLRLPGKTAEEFNQDADSVKHDLHTLKAILEA